MHIRPFFASAMGAMLLSACMPITGDAVDRDAVARGQVVYAKECAQCHGAAGLGGGPASLGLGVVPPALIDLSARNGGVYPRAFLRQYILGLTEENDLAGPMPDFARVGLRHAYPDAGADNEVLAADLEGLLDYLETLQD